MDHAGMLTSRFRFQPTQAPMSNIRALLLLSLLILALWTLSRPWGSIPALGALLDPIHGIWSTPNGTELPSGTLELDGLQGSVVIRYDERGVPHIFAEHNDDLYFAQGYVIARDRLWQIDFASRAASGRLSEVLGERTLEFDRYQRRIGMVTSAEKLAAEFDKNDTTRALNAAFTAGINAWIAQLSPTDYPFEFKLLGYAPKPWSTVKTALMFMNIRQDLSSSSSEHRMANTRLIKGDAFMDLFFSNQQDWVDPIIPRGTSWPKDGISIPAAPETSFVSRSLLGEPPFMPNPYNGSNNWALHGSKTASGRPLMANDPHLNLTLPAIWYEIQLSSPDVNVYGVGLAGTPGVTIGFNEHVAWGLTNTGSDVLDWLEITWKDSTRSEYLFDGEWLSASVKTEIIKVKGKADVVDQVYYTHHGPVALYHGEKAFNVMSPPEHAMRWMAHDPSNEMLTIFKLNRAKNKADIMEAITTFRAPAQNLVYATQDNDVGIISNGALPVKWEGQGKYPGDGSDPRYSWQSFIPREHLPQIHNPARGFVSSANQHPAAPEEYPYYLDYAFAPFERGMRINQRLTTMTQATPDSMFQLLKDSYSLHAELILPRMLEGIKDFNTDTLDVTFHKQKMQSWDYQLLAGRGAGALFQRWWIELNNAIWTDEYPEGALFATPQRDIMAKALLMYPDGEWIDDKNTPQKESLDELLQRSFVKAIRYVEKQQSPDPSTWTWVKSQNANINHLLNLAPFNATEVEAGGCAECVNAFRNGNGPSWKMVVSLEDEVKAWGVYPGGQSGNPASAYFKNNIPTWASGQLHELLFLKGIEDRPQTTVATLTLKAKGK